MSIYNVFAKSEAESPGRAIGDVNSGVAVVSTFDNFLSLEECQRQIEIIKPLLISRGSDVPGGYLGSSLFEAGGSLALYFEQVLEMEEVLAEVHKECGEPISRIIDSYNSLSPLHSFEAISRLGINAALSRIMAFPVTNDRIVLKDHEDLATIRNKMMVEQGLEVAMSLSVLALNVYLANPGNCGTLRIFKYRPSDAEKKDLDREFGTDLQGTGYPYPEHITRGLEYIDVPVTPGLFCVFEASHLHSVINLDKHNADGDLRISWNSFACSSSHPTMANQLLYWS